MKPGILILLTLFPVLIAACGSSGPATVSNSTLTAGIADFTRVLEQPRGDVRTPEFTLRSADGAPVRLSDYLGKQPLAVIFYRGFF